MNKHSDSSAGSQSARLIILSCACFVAAACIGLWASVGVAFPELFYPGALFSRLRPLHTFLSFAGILSGVMALLDAIVVSNKRRADQKFDTGTIQYSLMIIFVLSGAVSIGLGYGSGREYISWPPVVSIFLILATIISNCRLFARSAELSQRCPEGFWLIGIGMLFIITGLIESHLWMLPVVGANTIRDLSVQWHALDTFIAGNSTVLYGCAIYMTQKQPRAQRSSLLFTISALVLLLAFGHHHYASGQPQVFKVMAFCVSMLAIVSLVRHAKRFVEEKGTKSSDIQASAPLFRSIEIWTLVSIVSGVLFAVPPINIYVHGTYAIVIHSMGSMIGVNLMIILAGGFVFSPDRGAQSASIILLGTRLVNYSLGAMWLVLGAAGLVKGVMRLNTDYLVIQPKVQGLLMAFPVVGLVLLGGISLMCVQLIVVYRSQRKTDIAYV